MRKLKFKIWDFCAEGFVDDGASFPIHECCYDGEVTYLQYTGLKDKNGKEIYEGDIVKFHPWNSPQKGLENYLCKSLKQIKWGLDSGEYPSVGFVAINLQPADLEDGHQINWMDARNMEVIGNIFENHELLEA